jgi:hypothetical protein
MLLPLEGFTECDNLTLGRNDYQRDAATGRSYSDSHDPRVPGPGRQVVPLGDSFDVVSAAPVAAKRRLVPATRRGAVTN